MNAKTLSTLAITLVASFTAALFGLQPAMGQPKGGLCGVTSTIASGQSTITYDPFSGSTQSSRLVTLTISRANVQGGNFTKELRFYLASSDPGASRLTIEPIRVTTSVASLRGGQGADVAYGPGETPPSLTGTPTTGNNFVWLDYTGNNDASNTATVEFRVTLPANLDLSATSQLRFDAVYSCVSNQGDTGSGSAPNAFSFPINVVSGLQASYVGPLLDFGEVGDKTDAQAGTIAPVSGNLRVASSGPYSITLASQNKYRLTYDGGNVATEAQNLRYRVNFLGQTRDETNFAVISKTCTRAGLGSPPLAGGTLLPVTATLREGGAEEVPSTGYQDVLTVTVTPLAAATAGDPCS